MLANEKIGKHRFACRTGAHLRRKAVVHRHHQRSQGVRVAPAQRVMRGHAAKDPPAAVEEHHGGQQPAGLRPVDPHMQRPRWTRYVEVLHLQEVREPSKLAEQGRGGVGQLASDGFQGPVPRVQAGRLRETG